MIELRCDNDEPNRRHDLPSRLRLRVRARGHDVDIEILAAELVHRLAVAAVRSPDGAAAAVEATGLVTAHIVRQQPESVSGSER